LVLAAEGFAAAPPALERDRYGDPLPAGAVARLGIARLRHMFFVGHLAVSPDGTLVASLDGGELRPWDRASGKLRAVYRTREPFDWSVAFTRDGKGVVSGHSKLLPTELWAWDLATGRRQALWGDGKYRGAPGLLAFSRDGKMLAVRCHAREKGNDVARIHLLDFPSGKARGVLAGDRWGWGIEGMTFDPGGRRLVFDVGEDLQV